MPYPHLGTNKKKELLLLFDCHRLNLHISAYQLSNYVEVTSEIIKISLVISVCKFAKPRRCFHAEIILSPIKKILKGLLILFNVDKVHI